MEIEVAGLSAATTEEDLIRLFEAFGTVNAVVRGERVRDGMPQGFAVITMPLRAQGLAAVRALQGSNLNGSVLTVEVLMPAVPVFSMP